MKKEKTISIPIKEGELIQPGPNFKVSARMDLDKEIFSRGYIRNYINDKTGLFIFPKKGESLLFALTQYVTRKIIGKFSFDKIILPKMSPISTYAKANVLGKWDFYLEKVSPFDDTNGVKEDYILEPLQCIPFYQSLEGKELSINKPIKVFDCSGPTYRNEDLDKVKPMVKQREFHRSEFIYIGKQKDIVNLRENIIKELMAIFNDLGMRYRLVVGTGCFELSENEIVFPETSEEIPIKDIELYIPSTNSWLEVVGASVLWNIQTKRFNIKSKNNEELWSGCVGIGLERLMYSFLAQKGFDETIWPKQIKRILKSN
jgi:seryl-tRNA synthetase